MCSTPLDSKQQQSISYSVSCPMQVEDTQLDGITMLRVPGYAEPVEFGAMKEFAYPLEGGGGELVVATTRIETMLGDTAVAIHPEDSRWAAAVWLARQGADGLWQCGSCNCVASEIASQFLKGLRLLYLCRYKHLHGKFVIHPVDGRRLPIVCDAESVDMALGTGAVKVPSDLLPALSGCVMSVSPVTQYVFRVQPTPAMHANARLTATATCRPQITPAHDAKDFATGKRNNLEFINILNDDGTLNERCGPYAGRPRYEVRQLNLKRDVFERYQACH